KTYEAGLKMGQKGYPGMRNFVFTRSPKKSDVPHVEFVNEDVDAFAKRLRRAKGKHIWLVGGGEIIAAFLDKKQIDEFSIHVIPIFIGAGIPLIQPSHRNVQLK